MTPRATNSLSARHYDAGLVDTRRHTKQANNTKGMDVEGFFLPLVLTQDTAMCHMLCESGVSALYQLYPWRH